MTYTKNPQARVVFSCTLGKCVGSLAYLKRNYFNTFSISGAYILYSVGNVEAMLDLPEGRLDQHAKLVVKKGQLIGLVFL